MIDFGYHEFGAPSSDGDPAHRAFLRIRLVKKFADYLNGVDLSGRRVGEVFDCPKRVAQMLALEGWAEIVDDDLRLELPGSVQEDVRTSWHSTVKVHIIRQPAGRIDGISLRHYHPGQSYDVPSTLANFLVIEGYAIVEMRQKPRINNTVPRTRSITLHKPSRPR